MGCCVVAVSRIDVSDALGPSNARNAGREIRCLLRAVEDKALMINTASYAQRLPWLLLLLPYAN